jgi:hypothetical protein
LQANRNLFVEHLVGREFDRGKGHGGVDFEFSILNFLPSARTVEPQINQNSCKKPNCYHNNLAQLPLFGLGVVAENLTRPNRFVLFPLAICPEFRGQRYETQ